MALFNPFPLFTLCRLEYYMQKGEHFLVVQHFRRGFPYYSPSNKTCLLLTPYSYEFPAQRHLDELEDKRYSALVNLQHSRHLNSLKNILPTSSPYILYDGSPDLLQSRLSKAIPGFLPKFLSYLNRGKDIEQISQLLQHPQLELVYGELYVSISKGSEQQKIKLELIENG